MISKFVICYLVCWYCDLRCLLTVIIAKAGIPMYIPKFNAIKEIPNPRTCSSEPSSASDMIERVEISGVIKALTASLNIGYSLWVSAIVGANE